MPCPPFFRGRRRIGGELTSSAFHRGLDLPSIVIQSRSSVHLAQKKKGTAGYCGAAYTVPGQGNQIACEMYKTILMTRLIRSYSEVCASISLVSSPIVTSQTSALCKPIATASSVSNCCKCLVSRIMTLPYCPPLKRNKNGNHLQLRPRIGRTKSESSPSKRLHQLLNPRLFHSISSARELGVSIEGPRSLIHTSNASIKLPRKRVHLLE